MALRFFPAEHESQITKCQTQHLRCHQWQPSDMLQVIYKCFCNMSHGEWCQATRGFGLLIQKSKPDGPKPSISCDQNSHQKVHTAFNFQIYTCEGDEPVRFLSFNFPHCKYNGLYKTIMTVSLISEDKQITSVRNCSKFGESCVHSCLPVTSPIVKMQQKFQLPSTK